MPTWRRSTAEKLCRAWRALAANVTVPIAAYMAIVGVMAYTPADTGAEVQDVLPGWLTHLWAIALIGAGVAVTLGTLTHRSRLESAGHVALLWGLVVLTIVDSLKGDANLPAIGALALMALMRLRLLRHSRRAQQEAQHLDETEGG